jgi:hypothetical protein
MSGQDLRRKGCHGDPRISKEFSRRLPHYAPQMSTRRILIQNSCLSPLWLRRLLIRGPQANFLSALSRHKLQAAITRAKTKKPEGRNSFSFGAVKFIFLAIAGLPFCWVRSEDILYRFFSCILLRSTNYY